MSNKKKYLQITFGDGIIHEFSKTPKEGYDEYYNSKNVLSYRKVYMRGLYGTLQGVFIRDNKAGFGKELAIEMLDNEGVVNVLNMGLFDQKKSIATYAESFIRYLPQLAVGRAYRIFAYSIEQTSGYDRKGISVKYADLINEETYDQPEYEIPRLHYTKLNREINQWEVKDIPPVLWEEAVDGTKIRNTRDKDAYIYNVLTQYATDQTGKGKPAAQNPPPQQSAPAQVPPPAAPYPSQGHPAPGYPQSGAPATPPPPVQQLPMNMPPPPPQVPQGNPMHTPPPPMPNQIPPAHGAPSHMPPPPPPYPGQGVAPGTGVPGHAADEDDDLPF